MADIGVLHQQTRDELGSDDDIRFIPNRFSEKVHIYSGPTITKTRGIGDIFIIGSYTNGLIGVNDVQSYITDEYVSGYEVYSVNNPNNTFIENFRSDVLIDETSTGTLNDVYPGSYTVDGSVGYLSNCAYKGLKSVYLVNVSVDTSEGDFDIYVSADNKLNWQKVNNNQAENVTNKGMDLFINITPLSQFVDSNGDNFVDSNGDNFVVVGGSFDINKVTIKYELE